MSHEYSLAIRGPDYTEIDSITDWLKFESVFRWTWPHTWSLTVESDSRVARDLMTPGNGLVFLRDNENWISGPTTMIERVRNEESGERQIIISGLSSDVLVEDRLAWPSVWPFTASEFDVRTGLAENVMKQYVDYNLVSSPDPLRNIAELGIEPDNLYGATVTGRARFQFLGDLLRDLALAGGDLGFSVVETDIAELEYQVYQSTDRTADAIFAADIGNLSSFKYGIVSGSGNYGIAGGDGEGTARTFSRIADNADIALWNRRIEFFLDNRDTTVAAELIQNLVNELTTRTTQSSMEYVPIDVTGLTYGEHYALGDEVRVEFDDIVDPVEEKIREVGFVLDENGEVITPKVGSPDAPPLDPVLEAFYRLRRMSRRVSVLERQ